MSLSLADRVGMRVQRNGISHACFYLNFNYFHSSFYRLYFICIYPIYQHLHCSHMLNLSLSNRLLTTFYFKSFLMCLICFISTNLGTNSLNSVDVPLSNKQKNLLQYCIEYLCSLSWYFNAYSVINIPIFYFGHRQLVYPTL